MASKENNKKSQQSPKPTRKTKQIEAKAAVEPENRERRPTVVGIGASAGGLAALSSFFDTLPPDTGMAFVVVTHLHPEHESHMAELLQRHTHMPTQQVLEKTRVEPNQVYVIPPNRNILMSDTHLDTSEFEEPHGRRTPIDHFFRSMAQSGHPNPVAIILSGGGTDGSVGIKDVKEVGGVIMAQQPEDAEYDSMPRAALTTGLVDVVLPAAQLAEKLAEHVLHRAQLPHDPDQLSETEVETLKRILAQVHARTGQDFTQYKRSTILRRVERRMQLNGFTTLQSYLAYLRGTPNEAQAMSKDILIGVTNFFRDRDSWKALETSVIPALFNTNTTYQEEGIRVWSIGCATGEEAYGLAMLLFEEAARLEVRPQIQVFASDLDERSIAHARDGLYPAAIEVDVSPERLERFFTREGEYYRVKRELRDVVLFANHNVMSDPPFSRQHLIACRNVLIYLQRPIQDRIFDIFHYALRQGGYLFLGSSESAKHLPDLFRVVDETHRLYQAKTWRGAHPYHPPMPIQLTRNSRITDIPLSVRPQVTRFIDETVVLQEQHQKALEAYGPPSVIVNERYGILHVSENAGRYLQQPKGPITSDLLTQVRPELQLELRTCLFHAFEKSKASVSRPVAVLLDGQRRRVVVSVRPRPTQADMDRLSEREALVLFIEDEVVNPEEVGPALEASHSEFERDQILAQLQAELQHVRQQLQITIEENNSANEEMKAANEELQSMNEEYRSATEELETSKEELQSLNEELQTVNSEMRSKLDEVSTAHRELENLMGATDIPTLYLDRELRIQRFTAGVQELFNILAIDQGRQISDLTHKLGYEQFVEDAHQVLRKLVPMEREIRAPNGNSFLLRLRPYRTVEDRIEGVVATFIDINELKAVEQELIGARDTLEQRVEERTWDVAQANQKLSQARDLFSSLFNANPIPTALISLADNTFLNVNTEFLNYFGFQREDVINQKTGEFNFNLELETASRAEWLDQIKSEGKITNYETTILHPSGETRNILASIQFLELDEGNALIATFIDITARVQAEQEIHMLASELTATEQAERHRLAQILHDDLQQRIFAIQMQLSFLKDAYEKNDLQAFAVDFPQLEEWLSEAIQVTRHLSVDLSPPVLHGEGLVEATVWLGAQMQELYKLNVIVQAENIHTQIEERVRVLVFYAIRELLFNVVKHAGILEATVTFEDLEQFLTITVRDVGKGFSSKELMSNRGAGQGLLSLRHRLNLVGCRMEVKSEPGNGTEVIIEVPYEQADD